MTSQKSPRRYANGQPYDYNPVKIAAALVVLGIILIISFVADGHGAVLLGIILWAVRWVLVAFFLVGVFCFFSALYRRDWRWARWTLLIVVAAAILFLLLLPL